MDKQFNDITQRKIRSYGWKRDLPDHRDFLFSAPFEILGDMPGVVDLSDKMPPVYDQGHLGSCTANAIGAVVEYQILQQKEKDLTPSRLFIYYNERVMENTTAYDAGAEIRDGVKSINQLGVCDESEWAYDITKFTQQPPAQCYTDALLHESVQYESVLQDLQQIKGAIAAGNPVVFGFSVYESFESSTVAQTGMVPMPGATEQCIGGHAVVIVGYDDSKNLFKVRNSWGPGFGDKGYFYMPYQYALDPNLASDFWVIKLMM